MVLSYKNSVFIILISLSAPALANVGGVGGVIGGVSQPKAVKTEKKPEPEKKAEEEKGTVFSHQQILSIPFAQRHAYFQREVRDAVRSNGIQASYEIVSFYPAGISRSSTERQIIEARDRMSRVRDAMVEAGVPMQNVRMNTKLLPQGAVTPEVRVYAY